MSQQIQVLVNQDTPRSASEGVLIGMKGSKRGEMAIIDFYTAMMLEGRGFQIKAGTVTTPLVGDALIIDARAELCVDAGNDLVVIGVYANISIRVGAGTVHEYAIKSADAVSTAGDVFVPLRMLADTDGRAARATGRVDAEGGVTVTAELATTTRRHWSASNPVAVGAGHFETVHTWEPRTPPSIANDACMYMQIAASAGPSYYAHLDFLELPFASVS